MWGFLFLFTYRFSGFDILPDTIGYLLILLGLNDLQRYGSYFSASRPLAIIALILSFFMFYQPPAGYATLLLDVLGFILNTGLLIVNAILIYQICRGIHDLSMNRGKSDLAKTAMKRWKWFLGIFITQTLLVTGFFVPALVTSLPYLALTFGVIVTISLVAIWVINALMMALMTRASRVLQ